jgi:hypothetical protein
MQEGDEFVYELLYHIHICIYLEREKTETQEKYLNGLLKEHGKIYNFTHNLPFLVTAYLPPLLVV